MAHDTISSPPRATYRLQLHAGFGFEAAADVAEYLAELGISHLYASPYFQAGPGSTHGYDVLDHSRANEELGGAPAHARMCHALREARLGQILDMVPNHMSIGSHTNAWWWDVLENGPASRYADYFDVDWQPPEVKLRNTVLLPVLGDQYGRVLEAGELQVKRHGGTFTVHYHDHVWPLAPRSLDDLLNAAAERGRSETLAFIAYSCSRLPHATATDRSSTTRRHRDKEVLRQLLERLCREDQRVTQAIDQTIEELNADPDALDRLLERQNYRLAYWRTAQQDLDYRRFFDINTLISIRMEDEAVLADTHALAFQWLQEGVLDGLRIDHPDGLRDPEGYFARLAEAAPKAWIVVEKILMPEERLPDTWHVAGTTGYDFLNRVTKLFVDPEGEDAISQLYVDFTGNDQDFIGIIHEKKLLVLRDLFGSDINRLSYQLAAVCERHRCYRDYTRREIQAALRELIACFPVYRTYVRAEAGQVSDDDARYINSAVDAAKSIRPDLSPDLYDFIRDLLLLKVRGDMESDWVMRFQQHTGAVMAKGVEDTVFYNYNRFVALNEVGGDPNEFALAREDFHRKMGVTQARWARSMLASTTHDTKRSEDVRARLVLLAEIPSLWREAVQEWSQRAEGHKTNDMPGRNAEFLFYQTLVGAWPLPEERAWNYMLKAAREAKAITSWTSPHEIYENALEKFVRGVLNDSTLMSRVQQFVLPLVAPGRVNSLAQTLIKLTAPGVPDIYQGTELWDLSLVDPDNRRPVDYAIRKRLLAELRDLSPGEIMQRSDEGLPKLWLIRQTLNFRKARPDLFGPASNYRPVASHGDLADHVVAYSRRDDVLAVAPRLVLGIERDGWGNTSVEIPHGNWKNELTGEQFEGGAKSLAALLRVFPVALLSRQA